jgi:hypothetical protein
MRETVYGVSWLYGRLLFGISHNSRNMSVLSFTSFCHSHSKYRAIPQQSHKNKPVSKILFSIHSTPTPLTALAFFHAVNYRLKFKFKLSLKVLLFAVLILLFQVKGVLIKVLLLNKVVWTIKKSFLH